MIRRILTYLLSSGITVLVDFSVFKIASVCGAGVWLATYIARAVAAVVNFTINKKAVFQSEGSLLPQFIKYILLVAVSGTASAFMISEAKKVFSVDTFWIKAVVEGVLFFVNYAVQRVFIFRNKSKSESEEITDGGN